MNSAQALFKLSIVVIVIAIIAVAFSFLSDSALFAIIASGVVVSTLLKI
jgi:hypothetical protein